MAEPKKTPLFAVKQKTGFQITFDSPIAEEREKKDKVDALYREAMDLLIKDEKNAPALSAALTAYRTDYIIDSGITGRNAPPSPEKTKALNDAFQRAVDDNPAVMEKFKAIDKILTGGLNSPANHYGARTEELASRFADKYESGEEVARREMLHKAAEIGRQATKKEDNGFIDWLKSGTITKDGYTIPFGGDPKETSPKAVEVGSQPTKKKGSGFIDWLKSGTMTKDGYTIPLGEDAAAIEKSRMDAERRQYEQAMAARAAEAAKESSYVLGEKEVRGYRPTSHVSASITISKFGGSIGASIPFGGNTSLNTSSPVELTTTTSNRLKEELIAELNLDPKVVKGAQQYGHKLIDYLVAKDVQGENPGMPAIEKERRQAEDTLNNAVVNAIGRGATRTKLEEYAAEIHKTPEQAIRSLEANLVVATHQNAQAAGHKKGEMDQGIPPVAEPSTPSLSGSVLTLAELGKTGSGKRAANEPVLGEKALQARQDEYPHIVLHEGAPVNGKPNVSFGVGVTIRLNKPKEPDELKALVGELRADNTIADAAKNYEQKLAIYVLSKDNSANPNRHQIAQERHAAEGALDSLVRSTLAKSPMAEKLEAYAAKAHTSPEAAIRTIETQLTVEAFNDSKKKGSNAPAPIAPAIETDREKGR